MTCYNPLFAFWGDVQPNGKREIVWKDPGYGPGRRLDLPCGRCVGCRMKRSRQWAIRCMHEASLYESNCFVTLTYDDEHLPEDRSLHKSHFQLFLKRLRKQYGEGVRFYMAGEYGGKFGRPHYHALLFNHDFDDKELFSVRSGNKLFTSKKLQELWPFGFSSVGDVSFESAAYVARYVLKKASAAEAEKVDSMGLTYYERVDPGTGEVWKLAPEFTLMSRGSKKLGTGGIGKGWIEKFHREVYPSDEVMAGERKYNPPRFYDKWLDSQRPEMLKTLKAERLLKGKKNDNSPCRLRVKEEVQMARIKSMKRNLED